MVGHLDVQIGSVPHPSPASPIANRLVMLMDAAPKEPASVRAGGNRHESRQ